MGIIDTLIGKLYDDLKPLVIKGFKVITDRDKGDPNTFISKELGFIISWPKGWIGDREIGENIRKQLGFPITVSFPISILSEKLLPGFRPNIT